MAITCRRLQESAAEHSYQITPKTAAMEAWRISSKYDDHLDFNMKEYSNPAEVR